MKIQSNCNQSQVQQTIQKFESGQVHNATQQTAQKEHVCNHGQVQQGVDKFETIAAINQAAQFCDENAAALQKLSSFYALMFYRC